MRPYADTRARRRKTTELKASKLERGDRVLISWMGAKLWLVGTTMVGRRREHAVPERPCIIVGADVDESRGDHSPRCFDRLSRRVVDFADCDDPAVADAHVSSSRCVPCSIHQQSALDQNVEQGTFSYTYSVFISFMKYNKTNYSLLRTYIST